MVSRSQRWAGVGVEPGIITRYAGRLPERFGLNVTGCPGAGSLRPAQPSRTGLFLVRPQAV
jgi:hypothetical protein